MSGSVSDESLDALARRAAQGDDHAFVELVSTLVPTWYRVALHALDHGARAEEAVHNITVKVFLALPSWKGNASVRTWTHRIAINVCNDVRRSMRREECHLPLDSACDVHAPDGDGDISDDPLATAALARAVAALPPELSAVVSLRYGAELGFAEIASVLAIPQGTVSSRLRRALTMLATMLGPTFGKE